MSSILPAALDKPPKRLVLCFDGTGNSFHGNTSDTNIVKLYDKLDHDDNLQYHYYQTGIGTYSLRGGSLNKGIFGQIRDEVSMTLDEGFGWTFDAHVRAGYKFIMEYYESGDKIYMFGFSRGAYTARYLARMINTIGLLSKGNDQLIPFAYKLYQDYELGVQEDGEDLSPLPGANAQPGTQTNGQTNGHTSDQSSAQANPQTVSQANPQTVSQSNAQADDLSKTSINGKNGVQATGYSTGTVDTLEQQHIIHRRRGVDPQQMRRNKLQAFTQTFCRRERTGTGSAWSPRPLWTGVKVYFLGIFECVNSVAVLESTPPKPVSIIGTALHVRHAVAVDEFRVKFRAALLAQDRAVNLAVGESHREVWFPGNHGDVGGGWPAPGSEKSSTGTRLWKWLHRHAPYLFSDINDYSTADQGQDPYQLSDVPLSWMLHELETLHHENPADALTWTDRLQLFKTNFVKRGIGEQQALKANLHDTVRVGGGSALFIVAFWQLLENIWFFMSRRAFVDGKWKTISFWPNWSSPRDIPISAELHQSLKWRLENVKDYRPKNQHGQGTSDTGPCLLPENFVEFVKDADGLHSTYKLSK